MKFIIKLKNYIYNRKLIEKIINDDKVRIFDYIYFLSKFKFLNYKKIKNKIAKQRRN